MQFGDPDMLWLELMVVPPLAWFLWWAWRRKQQLIAQFVRSRLLNDLMVGVSKARQKGRLALVVAAVALAILALARPQWGFAWQEVKRRGLDIVVAIDVSRSMLAEDIPPNRLTRAKLATLDLMRAAKTDRLGLVAFAGTAFLQSPLTLDDDAFRQNIEALHVGIIPQGGSALADAIETAMAGFKGEKDNFMVLVIFSDGEDHERGAEEAAAKAAEAGLKIFTIGVGTPEGELLREPDAKGVPRLVKDDEGNAVKSRLNETLLREIATAGKGFYLPLRGAKTMDSLYENGLAPLPKADISTKPLQHFHERFQWPLALAIVLLVLEMFIPDRKRVLDGEARRAASTPFVGRMAAAVVFILAWPVLAGASSRTALKQYQDGRYEDSRREYQRLMERKPDDPRLPFNAGAAAYQAKDFEAAAQNFVAAANAPKADLELQQRAFYNLGNALYRLGEKSSEPQRKRKTWEQALKQFEAALQLKDQDADARFNHDWVKQRLEELKQQPQQQPDPKSQDDKSQDKKEESKDKSSQPNESKDENQPSEPKPNEDPKDSEQKQSSGKPKDKKSEEQKQQAANQPKPQDQPKEQGDNKQAAGAQDQSGQEADPEAAENAVPLGQMTPQQARQLLDALKNNGKALIFLPPEKARNQRRGLKDW